MGNNNAYKRLKSHNVTCLLAQCLAHRSTQQIIVVFVNICVLIALAFFLNMLYFRRTTQIKLNFFHTLFCIYALFNEGKL